MYGNDCVAVNSAEIRKASMADLLTEQKAMLEEILCNTRVIHDALVGTVLEGSIKQDGPRTMVDDVAATNERLIALARAIVQIKDALGVC